MIQDVKKHLGKAQTTIEDLQKGNTTLSLGKGQDISFLNFSVFPRASFVDYLRSGWQVSLSVAIDFTQSNGYQGHSSSLHALGP